MSGNGHGRGDSLLVAEDVHKRYGGVRALQGARLSVGRGEIHGLVGLNGSGKSTLVAVLSGQKRPDRAKIRFDGKPVEFRDPSEALAAGIAVVTQETTLVPDLTVAENILLGHRAVRKRFGIDWKKTRLRARQLLERLRLSISVDLTARQLRPDEQQILEIARALSSNARLVILDESTSSLTEDQVASVFAVMRSAVEGGVSFIFISHRLDEVMEVTDQVTVLRDGKTVAEMATDSCDHERLVREVVGGTIDRFERVESGGGDGRIRLRAERVSTPERVDGVSLQVRAGEAVGIAGVIGSGRQELLQAIAGLRSRSVEALEVDGEPVSCSDPVDALEAGVVYVPGERKEAGLLLEMSVAANITMVDTALAPRLRTPPRKKEQALVRQLLDDYQVVVQAPESPAASLSGGNQQKVMLAKWMSSDPKVLLLDEPTRGVDVGAKQAIYGILTRAKQTDVAMVISSAEVQELLLLCDRIIVLFRGAVVADLPREVATEELVTHYAMGGRSGE